MKVVFRNKGVIDPRSISTFGVSSKEGEGAIGFFGTGLKYAIAILLRSGCDITIYAGTKKLEFGTRKEKVRVDDFTFVTMNRKALGFTTEVGKTWEVWQAFREIYCNTLDEKGEFFTAAEAPEPVEGETMIVVSGASFLKAWDERAGIVLEGEPLITLEHVEIRHGASEHIYYRGIRALRLAKPSLFTYNVTTNLELTEDRTIKHSFYADHYVAASLSKLEDKHVLQRVLTCSDDGFESGLNFANTEPSDQFKGLVRLLNRQFNKWLNRSAIAACKESIFDGLERLEPTPLNALDAARMAKAVTFCHSIGFAVDDYPIIVTDFLGEGVLGRAHDERIFISTRVLMQGTKQLAATLIEEFIHLRHKLRDETYAMQTYLFDLIVSLGEQINGEPL